MRRGGETAPSHRGVRRMLTGILIISFFVPAVALALRLIQQKCVSEFPFFFSYLAYMVASGAVVTFVYYAAPGTYPTAGWLRFLISLLAEFAVLVEVSDHIFKPFPAIRKLGRLITVLLCVTFSVIYVIPSLMELRPSSITLLDLAKRLSLTKAVMIIVLLAAARYYRIHLAKSISGILLGFSTYLAISVANFAMAEIYGRALYARTLSTVVPLSYTLCLVIWTIAFWHLEPSTVLPRWVAPSRGAFGEPLDRQLEKFNTALTRLIRR